MSTTVDTNIVQMKFDNKQFEEGCRESMNTLDKLNEKINKTKSGSALDELSTAANKMDFSHLSASIDAVNRRFSLLGIAGMTAISEITKSALHLSKTILTAIPNQIKNGGWNRAMNIENAKFQLEGLGITWDKVGTQISNAVSGTAYGMDQAARAASQLASSGVEIGNAFKATKDGTMIDQMEMSLKAISGVAAQTNSDYDSISRIFTQVAGQGRLMGDQLLQLSMRGMNAAATLGKAFGKTEAEVRDMVSKGQISFEMFSEAMYDAFAENAFKANNTFQGALSNMKAALSRTGEKFAGPIQRQMIPVWNSLRLAINKVNDEVNKFSSNDVAAQASAKKALEDNAIAIKKVEKALEEGSITQEEALQKTKSLKAEQEGLKQAYLDTIGPFEKFLMILQSNVTRLIDNADFTWLEQFGNGLVNIGKGVSSVIVPIGKAFGEIFGKKTSDNLHAFADAFESITSKLQLSNKEMKYLQITFQGIFDVMDAVFGILGDVAGAILGVDTSGFKLRENFLFVTAIIGRLLTMFANLIRSLNIAGKAINVVKVAVGVLGGGLYLLGNAVFTLGKDIVEIVKHSNSLSEALEQIGNKFKETIQNGKDFVKNLNPEVFEQLSKKINDVKDAVSGLGKKISQNTFISKALDTITKKIDSAKKAFKKFGEFVVNVIDTIKEAINSIFGEKDSGITKTVTIVDDAVAMAGPPMEQLQSNADKTDSKLKKIADTLKEFGTTVKDFASNLDLGTVAAIGFSVAMAGIGIKLAKTMESVSNTFGAATKVLKTLGSDGVVGLIFGKKQKVQPSKIKELAILIGTLAASMFILAQVPSDKLKQSGIAMAGIAGGILIMLTAMTAMQKVLGKGEVVSLTTTLIALSGAVAILSASIFVLSKTEGDIVLYAKVLAFLGLAITAFGTVMARWAPSLSTGSLSLLALAGSMAIMVGVLKKLDELDIDVNPLTNGGLWGKAGLLALVTATLVLISGIAAKIGTNSLLGILLALASLKLIIPMADSVAEAIQNSVFAEAWTKLRDFFINLPKGWKNALAGMAAVVVIVSAIIGAALLFKKLVTTIKSIGASLLSIGDETSKWAGINKALSRLSLVPVIVALTGMMAAIAVMTVVISKIELPYLQQAKDILAYIGGMFLTIGVVAKLTEKAKSGAILASVIGMTIIFSEMLVLTLLMKEHSDDIFLALTAMTTIMLAFGGMLALSTKYSSEKTNGLIAIAEGAVIVGEIGVLLMTLSDIEWNKLKRAVQAMSVTMVAYTVMMQQLGKTGMSFAAGKLTAITDSIGVIAAIGASLTMLAMNDWLSILAAMVAMNATMGGYTLMLQDIGKIKLDATAIVNLVAMTVSMVAVGASLALVAHYDWNDILAAMLAMNVTMGIFAVICKALGSGNGYAIAGAFAMDLIALAAYGLGKAFEALLPPLTEFIPVIKQLFIDVLQKLVDIKEDLLEVSIGIIELGAALTVVGGAGLILTAGSIGLYVGADSLLKITAAGLALQAVDVSQFTVLAGGLAAIGAAGLVMNIGAMGLISGSVGLSMLALACIALSKSNIENIATGLTELVKPMVLLGPAGMIMLTGAPGVLIMAAAITVLGNSMAKAVKSINATTVKALSTVPQQTAKMGMYTILGYAKGMTSVANGSGFKSTVKSLAALVPNTFMKVLDIHSPSKVLNLIGKYTIAGYHEGMTDEELWNGIKDWCKTKLDGLVKLFQEAVKIIGSLFGVAVTDVNATIEEAGGSTGELDKMVEKLTEDLNLDEVAVDDVTDAMDGFSESAVGAGGSAKGMTEEVNKSADAYEKLRSNIENSIKYFEEFDKTVDVSKRDILNNMQSQIDGVMEWTTMLSDLQSKGLSGALLEYLGDMGPEGYKYVKAFEDMTLEELGQANQLFAAEMMLDEYAASSLMTSYAQAGDMVAQGFVSGLTESQQTAINAVALMGTEGLAAFNAAWDIHSPSRKTFASAVNVCKGFVNGIKSSNPIVHTEVTKLGIETLRSLDKYFNMQEGHKLGKHLCNGLIQGINEGRSGVIDAAVAMAVRTYKEVKDALEIHSPSRKFAELGMFVDKGFAKGIINFSSDVIEAVGSLGDDTIQLMQDVIKDISYNLDHSADFAPVIRPELDLSAIQNEKSKLDGMFENETIGIARNVSATFSGNVNSNTEKVSEAPAATQNIIFNQTNNSPKNIDPYESYRLGRNFASQLKGALT